MLFAVAESLSTSRYATNEQLLGLRLELESNAGTRVSLQSKATHCLIDYFFCLRIDELHTCRTFYRLAAEVKDTSRDGSLVALTDKARHIGLYHHFLLGNRLTIKHSTTKINGMRQAHKTPRCQTLWQRELQGYATSTVGNELWIEECCLLQILAYLYAFGFRLLFRVCTFQTHGRARTQVASVSNDI